MSDPGLVEKYGFKKTERGFPIFAEFEDTRGCKVRLQESSVVGGMCAYLFCTNDAGSYHSRARDADVPIHMNLEQAEELHAALGKMIEFAKDPGHWRNDPEYIETWCGEESDDDG